MRICRCLRRRRMFLRITAPVMILLFGFVIRNPMTRALGQRRLCFEVGCFFRPRPSGSRGCNLRTYTVDRGPRSKPASQPSSSHQIMRSSYGIRVVQQQSKQASHRLLGLDRCARKKWVPRRPNIHCADPNGMQGSAWQAGRRTLRSTSFLGCVSRRFFLGR